MADPLFFALWPDAEVRHALQRLRQGLPHHRGREPHPADLHLTLSYLGRISAEQCDCVEQAADAIRATPFYLHLDTLGFWRRSGILWCAPDESPSPLLDLTTDLQIGLTACGMAPERRPFRPHITLARKVRHGLDGNEIESIEWPVTEFVLAAGRQGQRPRYEILAHWTIGHWNHDAPRPAMR